MLGNVSGIYFHFISRMMFLEKEFDDEIDVYLYFDWDNFNHIYKVAREIYFKRKFKNKAIKSCIKFFKFFYLVLKE